MQEQPASHPKPSKRKAKKVIQLSNYHTATQDLFKKTKILIDTLNRINALVYSTLDPEVLLYQVASEAAQAIGATSAAIALVDHKDFIVKHVSNLPSTLVGQKLLSRDIKAARLAVRSKRPLIDTKCSDSTHINAAFAMRYGIHSLMAIPLVIDAKGVGVLMFFNFSHEIASSQEHHEFPGKLAASLSTALENASLFTAEMKAQKQVKYELEISNLLLKAAEALTASIDLQHILNTLVDIIVEVTGKSRVSIAILDKRTKELAVAASRGRYAVLPGTRFRNEQLPPEYRKLLSEKNSCVIACDAPGTSYEMRQECLRLRSKQALFVPLIIQDDLLGNILVDEPDQKSEFTPREIRLVEGIASHAAVVLKNALLYDEHLRTGRALQDTRDRLSLAVDAAGMGVWDEDLITGSLIWSRSSFEMLGYDPAKTVASKEVWLRSVHPDDRDRVTAMREEAQHQRTLYHSIHRIIRADNGQMRWLDTFGRLLYNSKGEPARYIGVFFDITDRKQTEEALRENERRLHFATAAANEAIYDWDLSKGIVIWNKVYESNLGRPPESSSSNQWWVDHIHPQDRERVIESLKAACKGAGDAWNTEYRFLCANEKWADIHDRAYIIRGQNGQAVRLVGAMLDITERKKMEEIIRHQAYHDSLTDLPNRALFTDHLTMQLNQAQRSRKRLAVLFIDVDNFKAINDTLGHTVGDRILKKIANRLRGSIRKSDIAARIGGDEFTVLLSEVESTEDIAAIAKKIVGTLQMPLIMDKEMRVTTSIGISVYPEDGDSAEALLKNADIAMYHAKGQGRNNYQFFNAAMNIRALERMILANNLRQTLERGELVVYYQPQFNIATGHTVCAEALVRWQHPELGLLNPVQFIPLAEEIGLIASIDEWVLRTACTQAKAWQTGGNVPLRVAVNLSARQFQQPGLVDLVSSVLKETKLNPGYLDIEIAESVIMRDIDRTIPQLTKLADLGVSLAIDDFGAGYSSLSYLKNMPLQTLKIDRSFIRNLVSDMHDKAIVKALVSMAHSLKMKTVAEWVETQDQFNFLHGSGCDEAQGFLLGHPVLPENFEQRSVPPLDTLTC